MLLNFRHRLSAKLALLSVSLVIGLLIAEFGLRQVEKARRRAIIVDELIQPDPALGHRLPAFAPGHDANGFRNTAAPERAEIVAVGDSQTWGVNVKMEDAWPQVLGRISGRATYNMSLGGYGPLQYLVLADRALALSPRIVVVGLYFGNDLYDAYHLAYVSEYHAAWRLTSPAPELLRDTIMERSESLSKSEKEFMQTFGRDQPADWGYWLRGHTAVGRLLDRSGLWKTDAWFEVGKRWARAHPEQGVVYETGRTRTVFHPAYRLTAVDLEDPRIAEGLRITKATLPGLKSRTDAANVKLLVLLIPSKESAYAGAMRAQAGRLDPVYERLVAMEGRARAEIEAQCAASGVKCVDALPRLSAAAAGGEQVYPQTTESHPSARGYHILATTVGEAIRSAGW
ncbi:MAG: hypothetical protein LC785_06925 [Acidobacteria bacterium]|nr:hypothetical protein [Acidobacteriota bacterium]